MLASYSHHQAHAFLPAIPSPLSPRSANIDASPSFFTHPPLYMSDAPSQSLDKENTHTHFAENDSTNAFSFTSAQTLASSTASKPQTYAQRARTMKKAPLARQDELRDRRRGNFLRKVREARNDDRWEARGDDVLRAEWMRERRAREEELAGSTPEVEVEGDAMIDAEDEMGWEAEAEEWGRWEDGELEELIGMAPGDEQGMDEHEFSDGEAWEEVWEGYVRSSQQRRVGATSGSQGDGERMVVAPGSLGQGEVEEAMDMS